jgi:Raf kinase inhibitor-like YbhB/YbcL family protein
MTESSHSGRVEHSGHQHGAIYGDAALPAISLTQLFVTSAAFRQGEPIPKRYTCDGEDLSPDLAWRGVPQGTETFALIMDDPDAPRGTFTHWVYYNLPGALRALPEDVEKSEHPPTGGSQGVNDFGDIGYRGPCPPPGPAHRYHLTVYALDSQLRLPARSTKHELRTAIQGHVLGQGELVGVYGRS